MYRAAVSWVLLPHAVRDWAAL